MTITTDQAIALAREVAMYDSYACNFVELTHEELTALCNKVRSMALLEAADEFGRIWTQAGRVQKELRRMAKEASAALAELPKFLRNSPHCHGDIEAMNTMIASVSAEHV